LNRTRKNFFFGPFRTSERCQQIASPITVGVAARKMFSAFSAAFFSSSMVFFLVASRM